MNIKGLIILFLILLLVPVFMGKVQVSQFSGFFQHPSWDGFKLAFTALFHDDFNYYKGLVTPWIDKLVEFIKDKIRASI
ncbi:MAG: hypothetical protein AAB959_01265 [Patescibacteria group bacterium]